MCWSGYTKCRQSSSPRRSTYRFDTRSNATHSSSWMGKLPNYMTSWRWPRLVPGFLSRVTHGQPAQRRPTAPDASSLVRRLALSETAASHACQVRNWNRLTSQPGAIGCLQASRGESCKGHLCPMLFDGTALDRHPRQGHLRDPTALHGSCQRQVPSRQPWQPDTVAANVRTSRRSFEARQGPCRFRDG